MYQVQLMVELYVEAVHNQEFLASSKVGKSDLHNYFLRLIRI